jgi:MoxR-like ATPase
MLQSFEHLRSLHQKKALLDYKYTQLFKAVPQKKLLQCLPDNEKRNNDIYIKSFSLLTFLDDIHELSEKETCIQKLVALLPDQSNTPMYAADLLADSTRYAAYTKEEKSKTPEEKQQFRYLIKQIAPLIKESLEESNFTTPTTHITTDVEAPADHGKQAIKEALQSYLLRGSYYHRIQALFRETDYVITLPDKLLIEDTLEKLSQGKFVLFLGDTGSGKSELARVIARLLIKRKYAHQHTSPLPEPIIVGGAKATDLEDLTIEKIITSRNGVGGEEGLLSYNADKGQQLLQQILNKEAIVEQILQNAPNEAAKKKLEAECTTIDFYGMHLFTEYHAKGLFKAMKEGLPLIIDEVNAIRPEVLIGINDYVTKKIGQSIALPNRLGTFKIAEGFCILTTGNDAQQHTKKQHYNGGRYEIDEAFKNRLLSYAKNYPHQSEEKFTNEEALSLDEYLQNNELYGLLLTLFFKSHPKQTAIKADNLPLAASVSGFELYKPARKEASNTQKQQLFFQEIKNFAIAIAKIQKAYQGESVLSKTQSVSKDYSTFINHRVISMRQIRNIIDEYQRSPYPLEYHIYKEYLAQITNPDEKLALLQLFNDQHFFADQIGDTLENSEWLLNSALRKMEGKENLLSSRKKQSYHPEEKMIISSQEILPEILGSHELLPDTLFSDVQAEIAAQELTEEKES